MTYPTIEKKYLALEEWYGTSSGKELSAVVKQHLKHTYDLNGHIALILGLPEACSWLEASHFAKIYYLPWPTCSLEKASGDVLSNWSHFPFPNHSIDLVLMPHILGLEVEMQDIMLAIDYILRPQGNVVMVEKGLFGLLQLSQLPAKATTLSSLRYFLQSSHYENCKITRCFLKTFCPNFSFYPASLYVGCAQKWVSTLTPRYARWTLRQYFSDRKVISVPTCSLDFFPNPAF